MAGEVLIAATNETGMADGARPWGMDVGARIGAGDSPEVFCRSKPISYKGFIVIVLHAIHCASDQVSGDSRLETESRQRGGCSPGVSPARVGTNIRMSKTVRRFWPVAGRLRGECGGPRPARCKSSTAAAGIRLTGWRWAFVFMRCEEMRDASPPPWWCAIGSSSV